MNRKVRVLVVDDSALMRKLIPQVLSRDPSIEVIGTAMDGLLGLKKIGELRPDVVTLDLDMPRMDGLEMLRQITRKERVPVIIFSAHTEAGASVMGDGRVVLILNLAAVVDRLRRRQIPGRAQAANA